MRANLINMKSKQYYMCSDRFVLLTMKIYFTVIRAKGAMLSNKNDN